MTLALKAREIMHQRLYVELCVVCRCMSCVCVRVVEIMYVCCHAQRSPFSMEGITELCCRPIWIEMGWLLYILLECRVNNSTQGNSQESVCDLLLCGFL